MATTTFDTLEAARNLQEAGIERAQAEAIVKTIHEGQGELATKPDIKQLDTKLTGEIARLEARLNTDNNWIKWALGFNIVLTLTVLAIVVTT